MKHVILMADIIGSSGKNGAELMTTFSQLVAEVNSCFADRIISPLTITLGDEFQGLLTDLETAADIIFDFDERCLVASPEFRLRYVVRFGEIDTAVNNASAHGMLGAGLTAARQELGELKSRDEEVAIRGFGETACNELDLAFRLYRAFYNDWPAKDRETAFDFIKRRDYKILAELHQKDVSTMWRKERTLRMKDFYASRQLIKLLTNHAKSHA